MELDPETAGEALAEYIIWLEGAYEPKIEWLRSRVNEGAAKGEKNQYTREFLARGRENNFPWVQLLEED